MSGPHTGYQHYHFLDSEIRLDCEACLDAWIADLEAGGATRRDAIKIVGETLAQIDAGLIVSVRWAS